MANYQHKRSDVTNKVPLTEDLLDGEIAVNIKDRKLFAKDETGNPQEFSISPLAKGVANGIATLDENGKVPSSQLEIPAINFPVTSVQGRTGDVLLTTEDFNVYSITDSDSIFVKKTEKGAAGGIATLDTTGKVPSDQIPVSEEEQVKIIDHLKVLPTITLEYNSLNRYIVKSFYEGRAKGTSKFYWDASLNKTQHNGISVLAPEAILQWDGTQTNLSQLLDWQGSGVGCFVREYTDTLSMQSLGVCNTLPSVEDAMALVIKGFNEHTYSKTLYSTEDIILGGSVDLYQKLGVRGKSKVLDLAGVDLIIKTSFTGEYVFRVGGSGFEGDPFSKGRDFGIINLSIKTQGEAKIPTVGIFADRAQDFYYSNLKINNLAVGLRYSQVYYATMEGGYSNLTGNDVGIEFDDFFIDTGQPEVAQVSGLNFSDLLIAGGTKGISFKAFSAGVHFSSTTFEALDHVCSFDKAEHQASSSKKLTFDKCYYEKIYKEMFLANPIRSAGVINPVSGVVIQNSYFNHIGFSPAMVISSGSLEMNNNYNQQQFKIHIFNSGGYRLNLSIPDITPYDWVNDSGDIIEPPPLTGYTSIRLLPSSGNTPDINADKYLPIGEDSVFPNSSGVYGTLVDKDDVMVSLLPRCNGEFAPSRSVRTSQMDDVYFPDWRRGVVLQDRFDGTPSRVFVAGGELKVEPILWSKEHTPLAKGVCAREFYKLCRRGVVPVGTQRYINELGVYVEWDGTQIINIGAGGGYVRIGTWEDFTSYPQSTLYVETIYNMDLDEVWLTSADAGYVYFDAYSHGLSDSNRMRKAVAEGAYTPDTQPECYIGYIYRNTTQDRYEKWDGEAWNIYIPSELPWGIDI